MTDRAKYELEDDLEQAEALLRDLPEQIERVRAHVREARAKLSGVEEEAPTSSEQGAA